MINFTDFRCDLLIYFDKLLDENWEHGGVQKYSKERWRKRLLIHKKLLLSANHQRYCEPSSVREIKSNCRRKKWVYFIAMLIQGIKASHYFINSCLRSHLHHFTNRFSKTVCLHKLNTHKVLHLHVFNITYNRYFIFTVCKKSLVHDYYFIWTFFPCVHPHIYYLSYYAKLRLANLKK